MVRSSQQREERTVRAAVFINPSVTSCHLPYILRCKTRGTAREDCDTKDFISLSKKVLVTLIRFLCSFFSAARRTNPEAPPQLSSLLACRYGRRRGLRNSLCSDSPRPFSSVFLAASPPDKGGIGDCALACILTPSPYGHSPYILLRKTPRNATGHGRGGECDTRFVAAAVY